MTENEAIERFRCCQENAGDCDKCKFCTCCGIYDMENIAINALKEVQKYRKIGTLEELKEVSKYLRLVKKHGTVGKAIEECAEYEEIGTVEELKKLKEKEIAKLVIKNANGLFCPKCWYWINHRQYVINAGEDHPNRCEWCGQKLDWEEEK